jgi:hypothetical protein
VADRSGRSSVPASKAESGGMPVGSAISANRASAGIAASGTPQ